jgi:thiamine monophosphate synthase
MDRGERPEAAPERVAAAVRGGVDWIQVRERGLGGRRAARAGRRGGRRRCAAAGDRPIRCW